MDKQKNLKVLQQYYAARVRGVDAKFMGTAFLYMSTFSKQDIACENSMDSSALMMCLSILQEKGFSDLYLNGRRQIGTKYGEVPMDLDICFTIDYNVVSSFRITLLLADNKMNRTDHSEARLCGQWHWAVGRLVEDVPLDMMKVIWGVNR
jgi:hypothetical protein